jgi:hypothetical protein
MSLAGAGVVPSPWRPRPTPAFRRRGGHAPGQAVTNARPLSAGTIRYEGYVRGGQQTLAAVPSRSKSAAPGKRGNPPKVLFPAGKAPARNCRKAPQIGLMIAKTLFLA